MSNYLRNIESLCQSHAISQPELADKIHIDISDLKRPNTDDLIKIASFFNVSVDLLIGGNLLERKRIQQLAIQLLVLDVDGVLTDSGMYYGESGEELKKFNAKDGMGIKELRKKGIRTGLISHGIAAGLIQKRASVLQIDLVDVGNTPKLDILKAWCAKEGIELSQCAYVGDDLNDIETMKAVGLAICPADAAPAVMKYAHIVLSKKGGEGCVRELIDNYFL